MELLFEIVTLIFQEKDLKAFMLLITLMNLASSDTTGKGNILFSENIILFDWIS